MVAVLKPIGEAQLKKQISSGEFLNTYVIFGTETYLKQHYVNKIIQKAVGNADAFNYVRFDGNVDVRELNDAVSQLPFLCEKRLWSATSMWRQPAPTCWRGFTPSWISRLRRPC